MGIVGAILLCCGIGPVAIVTAIDLARDTSSDGAGKGGVAAQGSRPPSAPSPGTRSSQAGSPAPPSPSLPPPPEDKQAAPRATPAPQPPLTLSPAQPQIPLPQAPVPPPPVTPQQSPAVSPSPHADGRIGESVRDGQFEFVVRSVQCGLKSIGTDPRSVHAHGQFCLVSISARNIGDRPQTLFEIEQTAIGGNGTEYGSHSIASLIANEPDNTTWLSEINPGREVTGAIVYELPEGVVLARLVLNDPIVPGGVNIVLR